MLLMLLVFVVVSLIEIVGIVCVLGYSLFLPSSFVEVDCYYCCFLEALLFSCCCCSFGCRSFGLCRLLGDFDHVTLDMNIATMPCDG